MARWEHVPVRTRKINKSCTNHKLCNMLTGLGGLELAAVCGARLYRYAQHSNWHWHSLMVPV